jgi:CheY-like chemotaxis protein
MPVSAESPILVIEDSDEDFETLRWAFQKLEVTHPVVRCVTGDDALDYLHRRGRHGSAATPLLILLDLNLPATDGREVLHEIKADPALRSVPVIVMTTSSNPRDVRESYAAGANAYMIKPVNLEKLTADLRAFRDYWLRGAVALPSAKERV